MTTPHALDGKGVEGYPEAKKRLAGGIFFCDDPPCGGVRNSLDKTTDNQYISLQDNIFEWDDTKAAINWRDHGVAFYQAVKVFRDPFAIEWIDDRENYGEERMNLIGICDGVLLHVTYTERSDCLRLISARRAEKHEQDHYYSENSF